jgi:hypothetical protein
VEQTLRQNKSDFQDSTSRGTWDERVRLDWSPFLRQTVKTHFSSNGELSHGVTQAVHAGI